MAVMKRPSVNRAVLDKLTDGFRHFLDASVQPVENGFDWKTDSLTIRFYTTADGVPCVDFIDNGQGMDETGREHYRGLCESGARGDESKKGRNGTGRLGFIHHAMECRTTTKTPDGDPYTIVLDRESMFRQACRLVTFSARAAVARLSHGTTCVSEARKRKRVVLLKR